MRKESAYGSSVFRLISLLKGKKILHQIWGSGHPTVFSGYLINLLIMLFNCCIDALSAEGNEQYKSYLYSNIILSAYLMRD